MNNKTTDNGSFFFYNGEGLEFFSFEKYLSSLSPSLFIKENSRIGNTLKDSVNNNDLTILNPYLSTPLGGSCAYVKDNGNLDILNNDFTLCGWFKPTSNYKTNFQFLAGKQCSNQIGQYGFYIDITTGFYGVCLRTTTNFYTYLSDIDYTLNGNSFLSLTINQTTKQFTFKINNIQIGNKQNYLGNFAAISNDYGFIIGARWETIAPTFTYYSRTGYSDIRIFKRELTDHELTQLYLRNNINNCFSYYPCNSFNLNDIINGYDLINVSITKANIYYSSFGTSQLLDNGYSLFKHPDIRYKDIYVPYFNFKPVVNPTVPLNYSKVIDIAGDSLNHNLADSKIYFPLEQWNRSDINIFTVIARENYYDAVKPKEYHISELNNNTLKSFLNINYVGLNWIKINNNSINDRKKLVNIYSFTNNLSKIDYDFFIQFNNEKNLCYYIDYYVEDRNLVTQLNNKCLYFNQVTKVLSLSYDNGFSFSASLNLNGIITNIDRAKIFNNGNIMFCDKTKIYYSDDNLLTYHQSNIFDINGNPFVPAPIDNFINLTENIPIFVNNKEIDIWGNYSNAALTKGVEINVWMTKDFGKTVRSIYKFNNGIPLIQAYHIHSISYNRFNNTFIIQTGDGAGRTFWVELVCDFENDIYNVSIIASGTGDNYWKTCGIAFYNNYMIWSSDSSNQIDNQGVYKNLIVDAADSTKFIKLVEIPNYSVGLFSDNDGTLIVVQQTDNYIYISNDFGNNWTKHLLLNLPLQNVYNWNFPIINKNSLDYYLFEMVENAENITGWQGLKKIMLKLVY